MIFYAHCKADILENCGIAWPNTGMWLQAQQQFYNVSSHPDPADVEAHAHSPRRRDASTARARLEAKAIPPGTVCANMEQGALQNRGLHSSDPFWSQHGPVSDPFIGGVSLNSFYKNVASRNTTGSVGDVTMKSRSTSSSHDVSMPDASRLLSPSSNRRSQSMLDQCEAPSLAIGRKGSDFADPGVDGLRHMRIQPHMLNNSKFWQEEIAGDREVNELSGSQFAEMMASFSPLRKESFASGITAPSNTRASSAANTPPGPHVRPSAASEPEVQPYEDHNRAVAVTARDPLPTYTHVTSAAKSQSEPRKPDSRQSGLHDANEQAEPMIKKKPVGRPRGRKEGKSSEIGPHGPNMTQRSTSLCSVGFGGKENTESDEKIGDGQSKRISNAAGFKVALEDRVDNPDLLSPSRKVSKPNLQDDISARLGEMDELTAEGVVTRQPLGELENHM